MSSTASFRRYLTFLHNLPPSETPFPITFLKDFVNLVMERVDFKSFLSMRSVCKTWHKASHHNQTQWIWWIKQYGKRKYNKVWIPADGDKKGYWLNDVEAVYLKTKPLYTQVFEFALRKRRKWREKGLNARVKEVDGLVASSRILKHQLDVAQKQKMLAIDRLREVEADLERVAVTKRRRIDISKVIEIND